MPPPRAHVFAAGIASIPIILRYARARRGPALQVTVCNATGAAVASTTIGPVARPGTRLLELTYQCHAGSGRRGEAYPDGTYQAVLVAEGVAVRTFSFTVGG